MIKKVNKVIAISDVHLGEKGSLFNDRKTLKTFKEKIQEEASKGTIDEFIIAGDLFDLSLASHEDVYSKARDFFQEIGHIENLASIVFIPGNHDHHIWTLIIEEEQITKKIQKGKVPEKDLKRVDLEYENTFLNGLIDGCKVKSFKVAYPNLLREIGDRLYFFHHGHLLDRIFTPANTILKPNSLEELESFNSSWTEGVWYHLVQSGRLGQLIKDGYSEYTGMKKLTDTFLEKFGIDEKIISRMRGLKVNKLEKEMNDYLSSCIDWYRETPNRLFAPMAFVFGHTHRKSPGEHINIKGMDIEIYNTGAWHGDINLAAYLLIDEKEEPVLKEI